MIQLSVARLPDGRIKITDGDLTVTYLDDIEAALGWVEESLDVAHTAMDSNIIDFNHDWEQEVEQLYDIRTVLTEGGLITLEEA